MFIPYKSRDLIVFHLFIHRMHFPMKKTTVISDETTVVLY